MPIKKPSTIAIIAATLAGAWLTPSISDAAMTEWQDLGGGKARLVANVDPKTSQVDAALEVRLEEGWSTYWRYPGGSGIPPMFDFSRSIGFVHDSVEYPVPALRGDGRQRYAGYKKNVTFPLRGKLDIARASEIRLSVLLGVCEEICIPAKADFTITRQDLLQSDFKAASIIALAKRGIPVVKPAADVLVEERMGDNKDLIVKVRHSKSPVEPALFVEGPADWYLSPARLLEHGEEISTFSIDVSNAPDGTDYLKTPLTYTLATGASGVEFSD